MKLANSITITSIGLGAMPLSLSQRPAQREALTLIQYYIASGGNFIDTADVYGLDDNDRGHNEKLIAKALAEMSCKHDVIVATKGGATRPNGGWGLRGGGHPHQLRAACEASLRNLSRDSIDLYYLHGPDPLVPLEESLGELLRLKENGKIQHIGIANVNLQQLQRALSFAPIAAVQNRCNPFCKSDLQNGVMQACHDNEMLYVAYCPVGGWYDHQQLMSSDLFAPLKLTHSLSGYQLSLAWLNSLKKNIIPIPGMVCIEQVDENGAAMSHLLTEEEMRMIAEFPDLYSPAHVDT